MPNHWANGPDMEDRRIELANDTKGGCESRAPTGRVGMTRWTALATAAAVTFASTAPVYAQGAPPPPPRRSIQVQVTAEQPPPPGYEQPPPGYEQPPPGYEQPPPGYGAAPPPYYGPPQSYAAPPVGPKVLDWEEGQPIPPGYHQSTRIRKGLVIAGAVTFGVIYLSSVLTAAVAQDVAGRNSGFAPLYIPIVGPFITIDTVKSSATGTFVLVLDGIVQAGSVVMFIAGLVAQKTVLVRNDISKPFIRPIPMTFGSNSGGVGLVGTF